ncbi:MAG TPA: CHASE3 domain-containing protein [Steroidobacteraceae bacterium]|jgi:signal transduction histidine kinase|nr:CHASE3 domain-containing protein [Steroidobacteraceae bacterium]
MKILGEELGGVGRWYIALPPLLLIGFLIGLFFLAAAGQTRLNRTNERAHSSQLREQALNDYAGLISDAESAQRGYLLTGESAYLAPYAAAVTKIGQALDRLHDAYGGDESSSEFHQLRVLTGKELGELEDGVALLKKRGITAAASILDTDVGKRTMDSIAAIVGTMRREEAAEAAAANVEWQRDYRLSRWVSAAGAVLNIGLVLLAVRLVYGDLRRRTRQAAALRDQKLELEREVAARTRDLTALSTHLQGVSEQEKSALSRELHDELGGLLVAARMDLSWLQQRLPTSDPGIEQRFKRIHDSLSAGVDLKRRVVEELRPTLLDNMGLFTALRWQFKETCRRTGLRCTETIPESELKFAPDAAIGVFRVAQEALTNILKHSEAKSADLSICIANDTLTMRITDDGKGIPSGRLANSTSHGLASMRHRVSGLEGVLEIRSPDAGGTLVTARIPLNRLLLASAGSNVPEAGERPLASRILGTLQS